ncbi:MAG TPA: hypothetical protein VN723_00230 [Rhizomicrobium sp.]|jgi:hypothetical protein|nr:hypothetical protein [Rhizomicrobium sp.]
MTEKTRNIGSTYNSVETRAFAIDQRNMWPEGELKLGSRRQFNDERPSPLDFDSDLKPFEQSTRSDKLERRRNPERAILKELINVLQPHAQGLRKWSVMRAIRMHRNRVSQEIPQKLEEQVERTFRRFCADASEADNRACPAENAPFYRAQGKAGEVWAVLPDRVAALLGPENSELGLL